MKQEKKAEGSDHNEKLIVRVLAALLVIAIATIASEYSNSFARTKDLNTLDRKYVKENNKLSNRLTILETNYSNIINHLQSIRKAIDKK